MWWIFGRNKQHHDSGWQRERNAGYPIPQHATPIYPPALPDGARQKAEQRQKTGAIPVIAASQANATPQLPTRYVGSFHSYHLESVPVWQVPTQRELSVSQLIDQTRYYEQMAAINQVRIEPEEFAENTWLNDPMPVQHTGALDQLAMLASQPHDDETAEVPAFMRRKIAGH